MYTTSYNPRLRRVYRVILCEKTIRKSPEINRNRSTAKQIPIYLIYFSHVYLFLFLLFRRMRSDKSVCTRAHAESFTSEE